MLQGIEQSTVGTAWSHGQSRRDGQTGKQNQRDVYTAGRCGWMKVQWDGRSGGMT